MEKNIGNAEHFNKDDLRFATSIDVADYRAKRLKCRIIVDLCSGIGIQSGAFAKTCKEVYSFEIDKRKVLYSEKNFGQIKNLIFETGDVLDKEVIDKIRRIKPDIIFCDPERLSQEKERNLESIKPDIFKLIEVYSKITPNICIEIPPQIDINKLEKLGDTEKEYLSIGNKLNRLDLYFGNLKTAEISVVDINGERIERINENPISAVKTNKISRYLYEISTAVMKAGLENEFANKINGNVVDGCEKNKILLTSDKLDNKFKSLCKAYEVIGFGDDFFQIKDILKKSRIGKVVIKYSVDPKDYWKERNKFENGLFGKKEAVIFNINRRYVICEEV
jgi:hypothetical protein